MRKDNIDDFVPGEYFVTPKNIDELLLERFKEFGVEIKYYYKSTGIYCVVVDDPEVLKKLKSLDYITLESVGIVRALDSKD